MIFEKRFIKNCAAICIAIMLMTLFTACGKSLNVTSAQEVTETTTLDKLTIGQGASITAPKGFSLTMTVDGVEKPMAAGTYKGKIVITKAEENPVKFSETVTHPFRQALYLDGTGVVASKSVTSAAGAYTYANGVLTGAVITSVGENFNGIYAAGGTQTVKGATINFTGNGGNDFAGYGAAIMSSGKDTTLIVDGANISTQGAVRTVALADKGSNLIIKNSTLAAKNGILPADYVSNVSPGDMKDVPWMLGLSGNCRATNLLGDNTTATYINDNLSAEGWGVLSVDNSQNTKLNAINSKISITGISGYGTYAIGNSTNAFYGCDIQVADYAAVNRGGLVIYGASTPETIAKLNSDLKLGLTEDEMKALPQTKTTINSKRFAVMWHGQGDVKVQDDTVINTKEAIFLDKGQTADINVDGSKGAQLNSENGIILQIIEDDDPGPVTVDGKMVNKGVYKEPATPPVKAKDFDVTAVNKTDVTATFAGITLKGDFYNAVRGGSKAGADMSGQAGGMAAGAAGGATVGGGAPGAGGPGGAAGGAPGAGGPGGAAGGAPGAGGPGGAAGGAPGAGGPGGAAGGAPGAGGPGGAAGGAPGAGGPGGGGGGGGMPGGAAVSGKNMVLTFDKADVTGVITATTAKHAKDTITAEDYKLLGEVTNTPCEAVNNGVIVSLKGSTWTVTATSYLTALTIADGSAIKAPEGQTVTMTVNGVKKPVAAGTYKGNIVLTVAK
jgi:hypothetical protein